MQKQTSGQFEILVTTPWPVIEFEFGRVRVSSEIGSPNPDAVMSFWRPMQRMVDFPGPRCLYNCEPVTSAGMGPRAFVEWQPLLDRLAADEWLWHAHPDPQFRVPHITHVELVEMAPNENRIAKAIAVVSNAGLGVGQRSAALEERNAFVSARLVDLFGNRDAWSWYRARAWSFRGPPRTYRGSIPGVWGKAAKIRAMSAYHAAVCLENTQEPYYFTEKFVDAVMAGCVPVYRAHPTVAQTFLQGAEWIDPAAFDGNVRATLKAALAADRAAIAARNFIWLMRPEIRATSERLVYRRIAGILLNKAGLDPGADYLSDELREVV